MTTSTSIKSSVQTCYGGRPPCWNGASLIIHSSHAWGVEHGTGFQLQWDEKTRVTQQTPIIITAVLWEGWESAGSLWQRSTVWWWVWLGQARLIARHVVITFTPHYQGMKKTSLLECFWSKTRFFSSKMKPTFLFFSDRLLTCQLQCLSPKRIAMLSFFLFLFNWVTYRYEKS